jgi:hypothetical protein
MSHSAPGAIRGELGLITFSIVTLFVIPSSCTMHFLMVMLIIMMIEKQEVVMTYRILTHTLSRKSEEEWDRSVLKLSFIIEKF